MRDTAGRGLETFVGDSIDRETPHLTGEAPEASLPVVMRSLDGLVSSPDPVVVFSSLVRLAVPSWCDAASATITDHDENAHSVSWPQDALSHLRLRRTSVTTFFDVPASGGFERFRGEVALRFTDTHCCRPFIAQLFVDRALAAVERERLLAGAARQKQVADSLEVALATNREIGVAVGILVATRHVTAEGAFDLLRRTSQARNEKLRVIAAEVVETGVLERNVVKVDS